jgi:hypothetical protein
MKRYVYLMNGSEKKLIYMEEDDSHGNIIYSIDHQAKTPFERKSKYSELHILEEIEMENGEETSKTCYVYDDQKRIISQKRYLYNEMIEEVRTEYNGNKTITTRTDGILVIERSISIENADGTRKTEFYEFGELFEIQIESFDATNRIYKTEVLNGENELVSTLVEKVDEKDRMLSYHKCDREGNPVDEQIYVIERDLLIRTTYKDHYENKGEIHHYTYDEFENETDVVVENLPGSKIAFQKNIFDETGKLIESKGIRGSKYISTGPLFLHPSIVDYHLTYEYED